MLVARKFLRSLLNKDQSSFKKLLLVRICVQPIRASVVTAQLNSSWSDKELVCDLTQPVKLLDHFQYFEIVK